MTETNYSKLLPLEPSQDLFDFAERYFQDTNALVMRCEYINNPLTDLKEKYVRCKCTACGESFLCDYVAGGLCSSYCNEYGFFNRRTQENITSYQETLCPECGAPVKAISISRMSSNGYNLGYKTFVEVCKIENMLCIVSWRFYKYVDKSGSVSIDSYPFEAYIADGKKIIRCVAYRYYFSSASWLKGWEQRKRYDDVLCEIDESRLLPFGQEVLNGTSCENSKLDLFAKGNGRLIVSYLRLWQKRPNVENLVTQGQSELVNEALKKAKTATSYYTNWRGSTAVKGLDLKKAKPHEILGITKEEYREATEKHLTLELICTYKKYKEYDINVKLSDTQRIYSLFKYEFDEFVKTGESLITACNYLVRQQQKYPEHKSICNARTLLDFWNLCKKRKMDLNVPKDKYPQNLVAKHDQLVALIKFEENQELIKKFKARSEQLEPFAFADEETGLMIFACRSERDLINEGDKLNHCVATYAKRHAVGETAIFFIRRISDPETPFFTLELNEKTYYVRQNRGKCNCDRTSEVQAFEEKWLEYLKTNKIGKGNKNGKCNDKSGTKTNVA